MSELKAKSLCILGRQPKLGLAELESLYGATHMRALDQAALLDLEAKNIDFKRLGGTIKVAKVLMFLPTTKWNELLDFLIEKVPQHLRSSQTRKLTLGLSLYGIGVNLTEQNKGLMAIKRTIRASGKGVRIVPNKSAALNSAQVLHNKLTTKGAWELLLVRDGNRTILAQTLFVQDIDAYAARDQARPRRDAKVGMLPPKLAQIMINLANPPAPATILDPFCGSGVVLQEALLMKFEVIGSDISPKMIRYAQANLHWLHKKYSVSHGDSLRMQYNILLRDATVAKWPYNISAVVSELYLGKPLARLPSSEELHRIASEVNNLLRKFLLNLKPQIKPGTVVTLAVPTWRTKSGFINLPTLDNLSSLGYNRLDFKNVQRQDLVYFRSDQIVARQLVVVEKKQGS